MSENFLFEEYLRSCKIQSQRSDEKGYFSCYDFLHSGNVALALTFQFFLNELCNGINVSGTLLNSQ